MAKIVCIYGVLVCDVAVMVLSDRLQEPKDLLVADQVPSLPRTGSDPYHGLDQILHHNIELDLDTHCLLYNCLAVGSAR